MDGRGHVPAPPRSRRPAGPQGTRLFSAEELRRLASEVALAPTGQASADTPVLEGIGVSAGRRFSLRVGRQTVGRRPGNDIVLDDLSVSASHAWIVNQQAEYAIMNTLSTNGTFVNGRRIHEAQLRHGDRVRFGQAEFVFLTRERGAKVAHRGWFALAAAALVVLGVVAWWLV